MSFITDLYTSACSFFKTKKSNGVAGVNKLPKGHLTELVDGNQKENTPVKCKQRNKGIYRRRHPVFNCGECGLEFDNRNNFEVHTNTCHKKKRLTTPLLEVITVAKNIKEQKNSKKELSPKNLKGNITNPKAKVNIPDTAVEKTKRKVPNRKPTLRSQQDTKKQNDLKSGSTLTGQKKSETKIRKRNLKEGTSCYVCGKPFAHNHSLILHIRRHDGIKPHCCTTCNKRFVDKGDLQKHTRIHTGEKPFICKICKKAFYTQGNLGKHNRIHSNDRKHKCHACDKGFNAKSDLQKHIRIHTGEKPFQCSYCLKSFTTNSDLNVHIRKHTGERPHLCETCGKSFKTSGDLRKHIRIHKGIKPYVCTICKMAFTTSNNLRHHERVKHR